MTIERRGPPLDPEDLQSQDTASPQDSNEGDDAKAPSQGGDEPESDDSSGESEEVDDLNGAGRVVLSGENVDFAVKVPPDDKVEKAVVVVAPDDGGDVKELTWLGFSTQGGELDTKSRTTTRLRSAVRSGLTIPKPLVSPRPHGRQPWRQIKSTPTITAR